MNKVGTIRPTELSNMMRLDNSTLTRNIQVMVSHGFLALEKGQDERSREISITDLGREKRKEAYVYWENAQQKMNHLMGVDKVQALHALINEALIALDTDK